MSSDAGGVRVWNGYGDYREYDPQDIAFVPGVWYPAAQAKAMEAVVAKAVLWMRAVSWADSDALAEAVDAYLATLPRAHGGEGGGA